MLQFMMRFGSVVTQLSRLLGVKFLPGSEANDTPVGRSLTRVLLLANAGRAEESDWEARRVEFLVKSLCEIEAADPVLLRKLAKRLLVDDVSAYMGARHEIVIASSLTRKRLKFDYDLFNRPDFVVPTSNGEVGIECTSAHISSSIETPDLYVVEPTEPGPKDVSYKLASAIRAKSKKQYASPEVVLSIDATNIHALSGSEQPDTAEATEALATSGFGAALIFTLLFNHDEDPPAALIAYSRLDSPKIAPPLLAFLDEHFPKGNLSVDRAVFSLVP